MPSINITRQIVNHIEPVDIKTATILLIIIEDPRQSKLKAPHHEGPCNYSTSKLLRYPGYFASMRLPTSSKTALASGLS